MAEIEKFSYTSLISANEKFDNLIFRILPSDWNFVNSSIANKFSSVDDEC